MPELVFPKIGGDPLYYSEANMIPAAMRCLFAGSTPATPSGTNALAGSFLLSGSALPGNLALINMWIASSGATSNLQIQISGNTNVTFGSGASASNVFTVKMMVGSPLSSRGIIMHEDTTTSSRLGYINNLYPGSPIMIFLRPLFGGVGSISYNYVIGGIAIGSTL